MYFSVWPDGWSNSLTSLPGGCIHRQTVRWTVSGTSLSCLEELVMQNQVAKSCDVSDLVLNQEICDVSNSVLNHNLLGKCKNTELEWRGDRRVRGKDGRGGLGKGEYEGEDGRSRKEEGERVKEERSSREKQQVEGIGWRRRRKVLGWSI